MGCPITITLRINDRIRLREVRLINENGEQVGVVPTFKAQEMAKEAGLDLVEVSPEAKPPVCKIMDYGKYKYQSEKKEKEAKKKAHTVNTKEIKVRPKIDKHDLEIKLRHIREFLEEGDKVRLVIVYRGREMAHQEYGRQILERALENLKDHAIIEQGAKMEGNFLGCLLAPKGPPKPKQAPAPAPAKGEKRAKGDKDVKAEKSEKADKSDKGEKSEKSEKVEKSEK